MQKNPVVSSKKYGFYTYCFTSQLLTSNSCVENKYQFFLISIRHITYGTYFNQSHRTFFLTHTYTQMCTDFLKKTGRRRRESLTGISGGSKQPRKLFEPLRNVRIIKAKNMQTTYLLLFLNNKEAAASYFSTAAAA